MHEEDSTQRFKGSIEEILKDYRFPRDKVHRLQLLAYTAVEDGLTQDMPGKTRHDLRPCHRKKQRGSSASAGLRAAYDATNRPKDASALPCLGTQRPAERHVTLRALVLVMPPVKDYIPPHSLDFGSETFEHYLSLRDPLDEPEPDI
ncbi:Hypothetical predicted protein [Olea europaea subsp. europaea]|uniref:Uncharacterized protein n=1 Tax=Olea europaea subsp. europaea TaxID=158383 RepID=A0A8S0RDZ6_OLEEU|nr:Hypothetical predicted protein [Olea europaea subsp. europaea]